MLFYILNSLSYLLIKEFEKKKRSVSMLSANRDRIYIIYYVYIIGFKCINIILLFLCYLFLPKIFYFF